MTNFKQQFSFWFQKQTKRKLFLATPFLCLLLLWASSHLLWGVRIEGNSAITNNLIEEFLQEQGIHYGMPLSTIPIYELKTNLRNKYDEITWVSIYLKGTYLQISLKERDTVNYSIPSPTDGENLTAPADGVIESVLVRQGTAKVIPGDNVKKGDILIEGNIQIPAQDGTIKEIQPCKAEGNVYLVYTYPIQEIISLEHVEKKYTGKEYQKYIITLNEHLLEVPFFKVPFLKYDCVTTPLEIPLLDFFSIPLKIHQTTYQDYVLIRQKYTVAQAQKLIEEKLKFVDIVFELVDSRVPSSSRNPMINEILKNKPRLILLTKSIMSDDYYNKEARMEGNISISEFIVAKHRNGPTATIELLLIPINFAASSFSETALIAIPIFDFLTNNVKETNNTAVTTIDIIKLVLLSKYLGNSNCFPVIAFIEPPRI